MAMIKYLRSRLNARNRQVARRNEAMNSSLSFGSQSLFRKIELDFKFQGFFVKPYMLILSAICLTRPNEMSMFLKCFRPIREDKNAT